MYSKIVKINTPDHHVIYGMERYLDDTHADSLVIMLHGLNDNNQSYIMARGAELITKAGFDTLAINLYDWHHAARMLSECEI